MAVYTYFDGMPGLWGAVRQEGFLRLGEQLASIERESDPVRHLSALGVACVRNAVGSPDLYRVMFDASWDLPDPAVSAAGFEPLVTAALDAQGAGRFGRKLTPEDVAIRYWADGHGVTSLAVTGVLTADQLRHHTPRCRSPSSSQQATRPSEQPGQSPRHGTTTETPGEGRAFDRQEARYPSFADFLDSTDARVGRPRKSSTNNSVSPRSQVRGSARGYFRLRTGVGSGEPFEVVGDVEMAAMAGLSRWWRVGLGVDDAQVGAEFDEQLGERRVAAQCGFMQCRGPVTGVDVEPELDEQPDRFATPEFDGTRDQVVTLAERRLEEAGVDAERRVDPSRRSPARQLPTKRLNGSTVDVSAPAAASSSAIAVKPGTGPVTKVSTRNRNHTVKHEPGQHSTKRGMSSPGTRFTVGFRYPLYTCSGVSRRR